MPPALWLVALPIGAVPIVFLFRQVKLGAAIAAVMALFSAWLALRLPVGVVLNLLIALVIGYLIVVKGTGSEEEF